MLENTRSRVHWNSCVWLCRRKDSVTKNSLALGFKLITIPLYEKLASYSKLRWSTRHFRWNRSRLHQHEYVFRTQTNETLGVVLRKNKNYKSHGPLTHFINPQEQSESERIRSNQVIPRDTWRLPSYFPWELLFFTSRKS